MAVSISREKVIQSWHGLVEGGGGRQKFVLDKTEQLIKFSKAPGVECRQEEVSSGLFSSRRNFLVVDKLGLRDYRLFMNAQDFGANLSVSWFLTINPGFLKKTVSKYMMGNPQALSMNIDVFAQQDLSAFTALADHCFQKAINEVLDELKLDYSTLDRKSKGFLSAW